MSLVQRPWAASPLNRIAPPWIASLNTFMKTFLQFANEAIQSPAEGPAQKPPRKIAGHTFAEEQSEAKPEAAGQRIARNGRIVDWRIRQ